MRGRTCPHAGRTLRKSDLRSTVLITDRAWPDLAIETSVLERAGCRVVGGAPVPPAADAIEQLCALHQPAAIMTCWARVSAAAIAAAADLRVIARLGVGLDNIAVEEATRRGVWVCNVPDYCVEEVSDHAVGMLLAWARGLVHFDREAKRGAWSPASARLRRVADLTCGLIGCGRIGRRTAEKLSAFKVRVLAHVLHPRAGETLVELVSLDELLRLSDVIIVHAPLTAQTLQLLDRERLAKTRQGAFLINVSRGGIVATAALVEALDRHQLSGAALDVLEVEPPDPQLAARADLIVTPHIAFSSDASLAELRRRASEEVVRVLRGEPPLEACNVPEKRA
jgi:D-3-phosphoglycerate dehydrogenase / 2-oxoglutarate reductase